jgi:5,10-methylene-tetrahydrofolate dehydrogenase/methenyl tetrahydrofolate cyclohydrolase
MECDAMVSFIYCEPLEGGAVDDDLRGLEVLLVEDSEVVGDAVKQLLELLGAKVSGPAATAAEATTPFRRTPATGGAG